MTVFVEPKAEDMEEGSSRRASCCVPAILGVPENCFGHASRNALLLRPGTRTQAAWAQARAQVPLSARKGTPGGEEAVFGEHVPAQGLRRSGDGAALTRTAKAVEVLMTQEEREREWWNRVCALLCASTELASENRSCWNGAH